jgi:hypothetical protein
MALDLHEPYKYADPYRTNWAYLRNMTWLQMKALKGMEWNEFSKYIFTDLWDFPWAWPNKKDAKDSVKGFITTLNIEIKGL